MFASGCEAPPRHHHDVKVPGEPDGTLLLMPAWLPGPLYGPQAGLDVFPGNATRGLPSIFGSYLLSSAVTGELLAIIDGGELTARRTAAASALAASYLARKDASVMLMTGTGRLSANLIEAHKAVSPLIQVAADGAATRPRRGRWHNVSRRSGSRRSPRIISAQGAARQADILSWCVRFPPSH